MLGTTQTGSWCDGAGRAKLHSGQHQQHSLLSINLLYVTERQTQPDDMAAQFCSICLSATMWWWRSAAADEGPNAMA